MALAISFNFSFEDRKGRSSSCRVYVPNGFTVAQYLEFGVDMAQILANISKSRITKVSASARLDLSTATIRAVAAAGADIFEKAVFQVRSIVTGFFARFTPPTLDDTKVSDGSDLINLSDTAVAAYTTILEDGIDLGGENYITPVDKYGNELAEVSSAREVFRKS